jgi:hypothetical protein
LDGTLIADNLHFPWDQPSVKVDRFSCGKQAAAKALVPAAGSAMACMPIKAVSCWTGLSPNVSVLE